MGEKALKVIAQKGRMGLTDFYITKMVAKDLVDHVHFACELDNWNALPYKNRIQRDINIRRVIDEIYPFFINGQNSFWGSIIVCAMTGIGTEDFSPITKYLKLDNSCSIEKPLNDIGILSLPDSASLIAVDGQHRLLAMKLAVYGVDAITLLPQKITKDIKKELEDFSPNPNVGDEEISVVFVNGIEAESVQNMEFHLSI